MTSLRRHLTRKLLLVVAVPVIAGSGISFAVMRDEAIEQFDAALEAKAAAIAGLVHAGPDGRLVLDPLPPILQDFAAQNGASVARRDDESEGKALFQIRRPNGESVARSAQLGDADLPFAPPPADAAAISNMMLPTAEAGREVVIRARARADGSATAGAELFVIVATGREGLDSAVRSVALVLGLTGVAVLLTTWLVVPYVVRRELIVVDNFASEASRIGADSLHARFSTESLPRELAPIGSRLNDLLARLETSFARERQFSADLAHELRTPIAELRSLAELALKWPESRPPDTDGSMLAIASQMEGVVSRLLAMHRSEHGQMLVSLAPVNLNSLLRDVWKSCEGRANAQVLNVGWNAVGSEEVVTDPVLLHSTLANLLQNAVDYTPAGGGLFVDTEVGRAGGFTVRVRNTTTGVTSEQVAKFFDRFFRVDGVRSPDGHVGLGLPLARAFARALGGDVTAALTGESELELTLSCPPASR